MIGQSGWPVTSVSWLLVWVAGGAALSQSLQSAPKTPAGEEGLRRCK